MAEEADGQDTGAEASGAGVDPFAAVIALGGASQKTAYAFLNDQRALIADQRLFIADSAITCANNSSSFASTSGNSGWAFCCGLPPALLAYPSFRSD